MRKRSKRYKADSAKVDANKKYETAEAVKVLKSFTPTKADQSIEIAVKLTIDPKKSEQSIRGSVSLPKGIGKARRVIVFADGAEAQVAKDSGADEVGMDDLAAKISGGWLEFDVAIAMPRTMRVISKLGKVLGPKGLMPSPKNGTVTDDVKTAVREFKAGKIEYRNDAAGNVQAAVGKLSFSEEDLRANVEAFIEHIKSVRPATVKGAFIQGVSISSTMGPGIAVAVAE
ncbi:MAG: 50S ribosomal protein L1 [Planctomycetota bacterium]|nr:MAG: 50S ribosomal protein L1 [Planctomycetota bacterium]